MVKRMRTYYMFAVKKNIHGIYDTKEESLYNILKRIKTVKKPNLRYGLSIYNQICDPFNLELLQDYFKKKYGASAYYKYKIIDHKNHSESHLELSYACLILTTDSFLPSVFDIMYLYNRDIFICDFENDDYFWLEKLHDYKKNLRVGCK